MTEFGGDDAGRGIRRAVGMPLAAPPFTRASDVRRSMLLTGEPRGYEPLDDGAAWLGLSANRMEEIREVVQLYEDRLRTMGVTVTRTVEGPPGPQGPAGPIGPAGPANLVVSQTDPGLAQPGVWVQTTATGDVVTFWVQTG